MSTALRTPATFQRYRPDVPEDVDEMMEHFNDPNWDYRAPSPTLTTESYDLDHKVKRSGSSRHSSEFDSESNVDSTYHNSDTVDKSGVSGSQLWTSGASDFEDESPYPEVRAAVSNTDDPSTPVNTFRVWFLGCITVFFVTALNQTMSMRNASFTLNSLVVQVAILPIGKFLAFILPTRRFKTFGYEWTLNPGPFNLKEHTVITAMVNVSWQTSYSASVVILQRVSYAQDLSYGYKILLALSSNFMGVALAGLYRGLLIWPASMIYPGTLVSSSLMNTMHRAWGKQERNHISRSKVFTLVTLGATIWYWLPGYLFTALSFFSWACWIAPTNPTVNTLFGSATGLGMTLLTFDWSQISIISAASPLISPWWAEINLYVSFVFFAWIIAPALYFSNTFYAKYMPISATASFDNTGLIYDTSLIMTDGAFDQAKYEAYSPMFLTTMNALSYACCFAVVPSVIVHTALWYGRDMFRMLRTSRAENRDVHTRLMMSYAEVPLWVSAAIFVASLVFGIIAIEIFPTGFPVWLLFVVGATLLTITVPIGILRAVTNQSVQVNFLAELLGGYIVPGKPVANALFKAYMTGPMDITLLTLGSMKLGHYMKVPPRLMLSAICVAVLIMSFVTEAVLDLVLNNVQDACTPLTTTGFTCPLDGFFADSVTIWGVIGAQRIFSVGQLYNPLLWIMLIGALAPIPLYILARRYPYSRWRYVNVPVALSAAYFFPPANGTQFTTWFIIGAIFQYFARRHHFRWWMRYNYIIAAGLDAGLAIGGILIVLITAIPNGGNGLQLVWWGNTVWQNTNDAMGMPFIMLPPNATFGPTKW
ncbi:glutathione transporter [Trametopsis cervina]|nr:glutathione transporter [Trametopsis cervina]